MLLFAQATHLASCTVMQLGRKMLQVAADSTARMVVQCRPVQQTQSTRLGAPKMASACLRQACAHLQQQVLAHAAEAPRRAQIPYFSSTMLLRAHLLQLAHPKTNLHPATHCWPLHHILVLSVPFWEISREPLACCARHACTHWAGARTCG